MHRARRPDSLVGMPPTSPEERPRPSTLRDLPRAAWISARASTPNRPLAVLSVPIYAFSIVPMTLRGGLYLDESRTGTVLFARRRPIRDGLVTAAAFVLWVASILIVDAVVMLLLGMLVYAALLVGAVIALVQPGGTTLSA